MARFHEPIRGKGFRKLLRKHGFQVYLIDEFKTSKCCPSCNNVNLAKFRMVLNPRCRQQQRQQQQQLRLDVLCHGLLRCPSENCILRTEDDGPARRMWNRDLTEGLGSQLPGHETHDNGNKAIKQILEYE